MIKINYLTEAVHLQTLDDKAFDDVKLGNNIKFKALCSEGVLPVITYCGEVIGAKDGVYSIKAMDNGVITVAATGLSLAQQHSVGVGLKGENLAEYNSDVFMAPVWESDTVYHEAVMFTDSADGIVQKEKKLLYPIDDVISVRNDKLDKWYVKGVDFDVKNSKLVWLSGGTCPIWKGNLIVPANADDSYVDPALNVGTSGTAASWYRLDENGDKGLNLIYDAYHEACTLYVTYKHSKKWSDLGETGYEPVAVQSNSERVEHLFEKLATGENINVLVYGDSCATGCSSTGMSVNYELFGREPNENGDLPVSVRKSNGGILSVPTFFEMATEELVKKSGKNNIVKYYNIACGGTGASWGKAKLKERIAFMNKYYNNVVPDIIYIKYFANDVRTSPQSFRDSYESMVRELRELYPNAPIICVTGKINNERCFIFRESRENTFELQNVICDIAEQYDNCFAVKATSFWDSAVKSKDFEDYLSNNINHANDFWARITAQLIVATVL